MGKTHLQSLKIVIAVVFLFAIQKQFRWFPSRFSKKTIKNMILRCEKAVRSSLNQALISRHVLYHMDNPASKKMKFVRPAVSSYIKNN